MDDRLIAIVRAAQEGDHASALRELRAYVKAYPEDADGWAVLGQLAEDDRIRLSALRRALDVDPEHPVAREALAARQSPPAPPAREDFAAVRRARATPWPYVPRGEDPQPLGVLIDERRITRQDLLWAAQEAREAEIREAAEVLLRASHHLPLVAMTRADARLVAWPRRYPRRPMGRLMDEGTLSAKALRQEAWHAADARVREAARILLRELEPPGDEAPAREPAPEPATPEPESTPPPLSGGRPMLVYHGADYNERQRGMFWEERQSYHKLTRQLRLGLDSDWALFLTVLVPPQPRLFRRWYNMLLGPPGLFVLTIEFLSIRRRRYWRDTLFGWWWKRDRRQPVHDAIRMANRAKSAFDERLDYDVPVEARLAWMSSARLDVLRPDPPVWTAETLDHDIAALRALPARLTPEQREEIAHILREWQK